MSITDIKKRIGKVYRKGKINLCRNLRMKYTSVGEIPTLTVNPPQKLQSILEVSHEPLVSRDIVGNKHSCIIDAELTSVIGYMIKVVGWYDNEMGYACRMIDLACLMREHGI